MDTEELKELTEAAELELSTEIKDEFKRIYKKKKCYIEELKEKIVEREKDLSEFVREVWEHPHLLYNNMKNSRD